MTSSLDPVFVHAWWRSASTYFWLKLRETESLRCFYEPLHEKIAQLDADVVEKFAETDVSQALRHPIAKKNYFFEYLELLRSGRTRYFPELAYERYFLQPEQLDEKLRVYLNGLISNASAANRRATLCFCRSQMRAAWMKATFGGIHVAQIRNPADQWASFKISPYFEIGTVMIALKLRRAHPGAFVHIEPFERFAQQLSKRPGIPERLTNYITGQFVGQRDCFDIFLVIWIASALQALAHSDFVLDVDLLATEPRSREATSKWLDAMGCSVDFSDCSLPTSTVLRCYPPFFDRTVKETVAAMRSNAAPLILADPKIVQQKFPLLSSLSQSILKSATTQS